MESALLCLIAFVAPVVGGDLGEGECVGGGTLQVPHLPPQPWLLAGHVAWDIGEQGVREGLLKSCWSEAPPRASEWASGADPCEVSIHHFYVCEQIPNKKVILLPSLYHVFYERVRRLII